MADSLNTSAVIEEFDTLRQEGFMIIQSRYQILTANIALVAAIVGVAFSRRQAELDIYLPIVFASVLLPSLLMNFYLTDHFSRISGYMLVRFPPYSKQFVLYEAIRRVRMIDSKYRAYTKPMLSTYGFLVGFSMGVSLFINRPLILEWTARAVIFKAATVVCTSLLWWLIVQTGSVRRNDEKYVDLWRAVLSDMDVVPRPPRSGHRAGADEKVVPIGASATSPASSEPPPHQTAWSVPLNWLKARHPKRYGRQIRPR